MKKDWPCEFPGINWLDQEEEAAVLRVVRQGDLFRYYGPQAPTQVAALEARAREFYGTDHALAVNSGTGALCTAMAALGIGPGCEVMVPAFMWVATIGAVIQCNAIPVLCEVDDSFNLDPRDLAKKISSRTRLIAVVHMAGAPCDMTAVMDIARSHRIAVLEDCAQCNGGSFQGRKVGTFGDVGIFSFQINKNVTAGEGGLIVTQDGDLYKRLLATHDLGIPWEEGLPNQHSPILGWGQGRRMGELAGAVANVQLSKLPRLVAHMNGSKQRIRRRLESLQGVSWRRLPDPEGDSGPFLILSLADENAAQNLTQRLTEAGLKNTFHLADYGLHIYFNIYALVHKVPLSSAGNPWSLPQNADSVYPYDKGTCPRSDALFERSVIITIPSRLTPEQEEQMVQIIEAAVSEVMRR
jgi:8-amino-3,8-dideoxy-alpha-D-manno-octulosonate transaminase